MRKQSTEISNLSQSLEDNHSKIEQTHRLIFQIEEQLKALTVNPTGAQNNLNELDRLDEDDCIQNQRSCRNEQNNLNYGNTQAPPFSQQGLSEDYNQEAQPYSYEQRNDVMNPLNTFQPASKNTDYLQNHKNSISAYPQRQNPLNGFNQVTREAGKIRSPKCVDFSKVDNKQGNIAQPERDQQITKQQVNSSGHQQLPNFVANEIPVDIKEMQREHFQEVTLLEQAYRKKLIQQEDDLLVERSKREQMAGELQRLIQIIEYQERTEEEQRRQYEQLVKERSDQEKQEYITRLEIQNKRLEAVEKEKQAYAQENTELSRLCKLVQGQNEILTAKYNRIISLYSQLIDSEKQQLFNLNLQNTFNKEQEVFNQNNQPQYLEEDPLRLFQRNYQKLATSPYEFENQYSHFSLPQDHFTEKRDIQYKKNEREDLIREIQQRTMSREEQDLIERRKQQLLRQPFALQNFNQNQPTSFEDKNQKLSGNKDNVSTLKQNLDGIKATLDGDLKVTAEFKDIQPSEPISTLNTITNGSFSSPSKKMKQPSKLDKKKGLQGKSKK